MAKMLGRWRTPGCWSGTPSDHRTHPDGGPDCSGHERDTRWRKRVEQREVEREIADEVAELARVGQRVIVHESESGLSGDAVVTDVDADRQLIYLRVGWAALSAAEPGSPAASADADAC